MVRIPLGGGDITSRDPSLLERFITCVIDHAKYCWNHLIMPRLNSRNGNTAGASFQLSDSRKRLCMIDNVVIKSYLDSSDQQAMANAAAMGGGVLMQRNLTDGIATIICYPEIKESECDSVTVKQVKALLNCLIEKGPHGDIRWCNLVFAAEGLHAVDWDFSKLERYPFNYNININDGCRHPDARPLQPIKKEHDYYSFGYVMKEFLCPAVKENCSAWKTATDVLLKTQPNVTPFLGLPDGWTLQFSENLVKAPCKVQRLE